ncbi:glycosyl hydrolase [Phaeosphaeriaceae sp. PMI808]|nr:glycosyl hydrolase [Phaeosphaeriaceae sp. PMI808]
MTSQILSIAGPTTTLVNRKVPIVSISSTALNIDTTPEPSKRWRPRLHITAPRGWLNDPCAPGYDPVNNVYHLGFQWNPNSTEWGNISWGAALSHDLLSWEISDYPSMQPSPRHDPSGVFTGCLVPTTIDGAENSYLTAVYTSVSHLPIHHTRPYVRTSEAVALAISNDSGKTWTRHRNNPILAEPPQGIDVTGWRDPFVAPWPSMDKLVTQHRAKEDTKFMYAVVAGGIRGTTPTAFLYRVDAHALDAWQYLGPLITPGLNFCPSPRWTGDFGVNWEVSNFLSLTSMDGCISRDFLICGVEGRLATAEDIRTKGNSRSTNAQMWICGSLEQALDVHMKYRFGGILDHGAYYAGNSFWDPQTQQQVIYGWILEDDLESEVRQQQGWAGVVSLPRVVKLHVLSSVLGTLSCPLRSIGSIELIPEDEDGSSFTIVSLCAVPDSRLRKLRGCKFSPKEDLTRSLGVPFTFPEAWSQWEMKMTFNFIGDTTKLGFDIKHSPTEYTRVYFDPKLEIIIVDRSRSSHQSGVRRCREEAPHTLFAFREFDKDGHPTGKRRLETLNFHVLYDCSVLQIFVNKRTAITTRVYPAMGTSTGILPFVEGGFCSSSDRPDAEAWSLALWPLSLPV